MGNSGFVGALLRHVQSGIPAAAVSAYRTGPNSHPERYFAASTRWVDEGAGWRAYLSGPQQRDWTLLQTDSRLSVARPIVCHISESEMPLEHRRLIYQAQGLRERVSAVMRQPDGSVFALNFYSMTEGVPFTSDALLRFVQMAPLLLAITTKHVDISFNASAPCTGGVHRERLIRMCPTLTKRELDVCERVLRGMTQDGIAVDLGISPSTAKTYRNRAFCRLGISFRGQLFARMMDPPDVGPGLRSSESIEANRHGWASKFDD